MKNKSTTITRRMDVFRITPIFAGLDDSGLRALSEVSSVREYDDGEYLFQQDEAATGFYILVDGIVNVHRFGPDGRQQILHVFDCSGEPCGEVAVFEGGTYPAAAVSTGSTSTIYLPRDSFLQVARKNPEILLKMIATLSVRLRRFVGLIDDLSLKDVSARLAKHIQELSLQADSNLVELSTTKTVLASKLGTIAETLSRTLRKMQSKKIIRVKGRQITVLDEDVLDDIAAGEKL